MSVLLPVVLFAIVGIYWFMTQILPERRQSALLRPGFGHGLLTDLNDRRHEAGLPLLEMDEDLMQVAEGKAVHQIMTGESDNGWEYPEHYRALFGRGLLMEIVLSGPAEVIGRRLGRQRDVFDGEWVSCGIGVAGGQSRQVVLAMVVCRDAWEPAVEVAQNRGWVARVGLRI
ncbi:MAG: hypothetical protein ACR2JC_01505 [Chloroflexota bacterium]|nr:MAG: hypothetical protein DLM70_19445 [Chloroflexota bacterium]